VFFLLRNPLHNRKYVPNMHLTLKRFVNRTGVVTVWQLLHKIRHAMSERDAIY